MIVFIVNCFIFFAECLVNKANKQSNKFIAFLLAIMSIVLTTIGYCIAKVCINLIQLKLRVNHRISG
jgi:uncharacterized membrane protein SirB2